MEAPEGDRGPDLPAGVLAGAVVGAIAWPLLALGYSPNDYSVVAVPFMTVRAARGVITSTGYAGRRPDGVFVSPITALGP